MSYLLGFVLIGFAAFGLFTSLALLSLTQLAVSILAALFGFHLIIRGILS